MSSSSSVFELTDESWGISEVVSGLIGLGIGIGALSSNILLPTDGPLLVLSSRVSVLEIVLTGTEVDALVVFTEEFSVILGLEVLPILELELED